MLIPLPSTPEVNKSSKSPRVVQLLILTNVLVFAYQLYSDYRGLNFAVGYGAIPQQITHLVSSFPQLPNVLHPTLITSLFLHDVRVLQGGLLHLIGNMLYLSAFGPNLESIIGHVKFLLFYLLCGALATLCYVMFHYNSGVPLIGASGAIAGVMGAHFIVCPTSRIRCLFLIYIVSLPASVVLVPWIGIQLLNFAYLSYQGVTVAWLAHIGGFLAGLFFIGKFHRSWLRFKHEPSGSLKHRYSEGKISAIKVNY